MKHIIVVMLLMLAVGTAQAYQNFTTPDGAFTASLLDGQITTTDVHTEVPSVAAGTTFRWQTYDNNGFSVAMLETRDPNATGPEDLEVAVNVCRTYKGCTVLTDVKGTYNGVTGVQYSFTLPNNQGALILATARMWESITGHTVYGIAVYEQVTNHNESRVNSYLNSAVLPK
jgi:hypothetical protein